MKLEQRLKTGGVKRLASFLVVGLSLLLVINCGGSGGGDGSGTGSGLEVNTNSVSFTANYYGAFPSNQPVLVTVTAPDAYYIIAGYPPGITPPPWLDMSISGSGSPFTLNLRITSTSVSPGTHQTTVRVACTRSDNSLITYRDITVNYTVTNVSTVAPQTLNFSHTIGSVLTPADQSVSIGGQGFSWTASANQAWVHLGSTSGTSPSTLSVGVDPAGLLIGIHSAVLTVSDGSTSKTVDITLTITDGLTVAPPALDFSCYLGSSATPADQSVIIDGPSIAWTASVNQGWVQLGSVSGTSPSTLSVGVDPTGLAAGIHAAVLTISYGSTSKTVPVNLTIGAPSFSVTPSTIVLGGTSGLDEATQSLQFSLSTGTNAYSWTATLTTNSNGSWLLADATSGMVSASPVSINVDAERSALTGGTYAGNIELNATVNGEVVSIDIPVTLNTSAHKLFVPDNGVALSSMPTLSKMTHTVEVKDTYGLTTTNWNAVSDQSWLSVTTSGTTSDNLVLSADPAGLGGDTVHYATVTISSPDAGIENTETIRVGFWVGSSDPASVFSDSTAYSEIIADAIRPYAYAHNGGTDIDIYNVYTGAVVDTISDVATQLGPMAKSSDGASLYALDLTNLQILAIDLDTLAVGPGWDLATGAITYARIAYARPKGTGVLLVSNGWAYDATNGTRHTQDSFYGSVNIATNLNSDVMILQRLGSSSHDLYRFSLDYSTFGPQQLFITLEQSAYETAFAGDVAVSDDGSRVYSACGGYYGFRIYDGDTLTLDQSLLAAAYPNNAEVGQNGLFYGGISSWYGPTDIWVYDSSDALQSSYYASGYADNILERQLKVSADGFRIILLTTDPSIQFITGP